MFKENAYYLVTMKNLGLTDLQLVFLGKLDMALDFKALALANKNSMFIYNRTNQLE